MSSYLVDPSHRRTTTPADEEDDYSYYSNAFRDDGIRSINWEWCSNRQEGSRRIKIGPIR